MNLMKQAAILARIITSLSRVLNIAGMVVLVAMMMLSVSDVFMRSVFNRPILGSMEVTEFMMVALSLGMGWCLLKGKVIKMGMIVDRLPPKIQGVITSITYIIGLAALVLITRWTFLESLKVKKMNSVSAILNIPTYPFYGLLAFSFSILCLAILVTIVSNTVKAAKG
jgi:TRAP-type C4-dicarboxylate transport system permease small subunit